jgi:PAS domain S-box-containing protein
MGPGLLLVISVTAFAGIPLAVACLRTQLRTPLLYCYIASMTVIAGMIGPAYTIPISAHVVIWSGQVLYAAFIFSTLITALLGRDLEVVRKTVAIVVLVNLVAALAYWLAHAALEAGLPNPLGLPMVLFEASMIQQVIGIALSVVELVILLAVLEWTKARLSTRAMIPVYPLAYLGVLVLDGALYPLLVLRPSSGILPVIADGIAVKLVLGVLYAVPLLLFALFARRALRDYESRSLGLRYLADLSRDPLLDQLDTTARTANRASATTARILDAATSTVLVATDADLVVTHFNRGAERLLGVAAATVVGRPLDLLMPGCEVARHAAGLGVPTRLPDVVHAQVRDRVPRDWCFAVDGAELVLSLNITAIESDRVVEGYLFAGEDVTSRLRAAEAVRVALDNEQASLARLREADRVKQHLISTVSHELRTPIASIRGYLELLADGDFGTLSPAQFGAVDRALRGTGRLERLVSDLLVLERADAGTVTERRTVVDLRDVVISCTEELRPGATGRSLELDVPPTPVTTAGDPDALRRVVLNLVENAVKFTPPDGQIVVRLRDLQPGARIEVVDTGIGISPEEHPRVFTKFYRTADARAIEAQGTGLGLSIVQTLVEEHDGVVRIDSERHRGTTVTVDLPA